GFEIQRSLDGINYTTIGFVNSMAPAGTSSDQLSYSFVDLNPQGTKQYYRLRQVDYDNNSKLTNIILIKGELPSKILISTIYPNPVKEILNVLIESPQHSKIELQIVDQS